MKTINPQKTYNNIFNVIALSLLLLIQPVCFAQAVNIRVDVITKNMPEATKMVQVMCVASSSSETIQGMASSALNDGEFLGHVDVPLDLTKLIGEYENIHCELRLCNAVYTASHLLCPQPITNAENNNKQDLFKTYDGTAFNQIYAEQTISSATLVTAPPPAVSFQTAGNKNKTGKGTINVSAGDTHAAVDTANAIAQVVSKASTANVTGLVVGLVGLVGSKILGTGGTAGGIAGDAFGLGFTFLGAAVGSSTVAATTAALPVTGALLGAYALTEKVDKATGNQVLKLAEYLSPHADNSELDDKIRDILAARKPAEEAAKNNTAGDTPNPAANPGTGGTSNPGAGAGAGTLKVLPKAPLETPAKVPNQSPPSGHGNDPTGGNAVAPTSNSAPNDSTYTLLDSGVTADGQKYYTWVLTNSPTNEDGTYTTTYTPNSEGGFDYVVTNALTGEVVDHGRSDTLPAEISPGSSTQTTDDGQAMFGGEGGDKSDGGGGDGSDGSDGGGGDGSDGSDGGGGDGSDGSDGSDDDGGGDCDKEGGECKNKEPAPEESKDDKGDDTTDEQEITPNPNDQKNVDRSEALAWAMNNPGNPLAQKILNDAAVAISEASGYCQLGCADAMSEGGLLWAMLNPDNALAQSILAKAAESISAGSGRGQTGGPDNNPNDEIGNFEPGEYDLMQIELMLAGGGVVDPAEGDGSHTPLNPETSPLTGGGGPPISAGSINAPAIGHFSNDDPDNPDTPEGGGNKPDDDNGSPPPGNNPFSAEQLEIKENSNTSIQNSVNSSAPLNTDSLKDSVKSQQQ